MCRREGRVIIAGRKLRLVVMYLIVEFVIGIYVIDVHHLVHYQKKRNVPTVQIQNLNRVQVNH